MLSNWLHCTAFLPNVVGGNAFSTCPASRSFNSAFYLHKSLNTHTHTRPAHYWFNLFALFCRPSENWAWCDRTSSAELYSSFLDWVQRNRLVAALPPGRPSLKFPILAAVVCVPCGCVWNIFLPLAGRATSIASMRRLIHPYFKQFK